MNSLKKIHSFLSTFCSIESRVPCLLRFEKKHFATQIPEAGTKERLFRKIDIELRAHQPDVLKSYSYVFETVAKRLGVNITNSVVEHQPHLTRKTLLKSKFKHKRARAQYEFRTYFRSFTLEKLTQSTRDTFLEYMQRNVPEGVAMKVTQQEYKPLPQSIRKDVDNKIVKNFSPSDS